jgi:ABC-type uncharacterized transport system involved in gliding motility auxiliary subunit
MKPSPNSARPARFQANLNNWIKVILSLAILFMVNYLGYKYYYRTDVNQNRFYALSEKTVNVLKSLKEPVKITLYFSPNELGNPSRLRAEIEGLVKEYQYRGGSKIIVEKVDPALDMARAEELSKRLKFGGAENIVIFEYKDRNSFLREDQLADFDFPRSPMSQEQPVLKSFKGEAQFTSAIMSLVEGKAAKIYFLIGHGERDPEDMSSLGGAGKLATYIKRENMEVAKLNLGETPDVPDDAQALIIDGPRVGLSVPETQAITAYLEKKGKLILFQDPQTTSGLEPLLQKYGIRIENDLVVARARIMGNSKAEAVIATVTGTDFNPAQPITQSLAGYNIDISNARSLTLTPDPSGGPSQKTAYLLRTPQGYWGETDFNTNPPVFDSTKDIAGPLVVAALYDGGDTSADGVNVPGTKIVVVGASGIVTNRNLDSVGVDFTTNALNWMLKKEMAVGIGPKTPLEYALKVSPLQARTIVWMVWLILPGASLIVGILVWYSRRK